MAEQRTNDQSPKGGTEYTPEILSKMSMEELAKVRKEIEKRLKQRGSSRPVTHANNWLDNKKSERDYLSMVDNAISDKVEEGVKTFGEFIKEDLTDEHSADKEHLSIKVLLHYISILSDPTQREKFDQEMDAMGIAYDQFVTAINNAKNIIGE